MVEVAATALAGQTNRGQVGKIALGERDTEGPRASDERALRWGQGLLEGAPESGVGLPWGPAAAGERGGRDEKGAKVGSHGLGALMPVAANAETADALRAGNEPSVGPRKGPKLWPRELAGKRRRKLGLP